MATSPENRARIQVRVEESVREQAAYWAGKRGFKSVNEYVVQALEERLLREVGDYTDQLPDVVVGRLGQLIDEMRSLATRVDSMERVLTAGFDSLIGLTRGDSDYLLDDAGEL